MMSFLAASYAPCRAAPLPGCRDAVSARPGPPAEDAAGDVASRACVAGWTGEATAALLSYGRGDRPEVLDAARRVFTAEGRRDFEGAVGNVVEAVRERGWKVVASVSGTVEVHPQAARTCDGCLAVWTVLVPLAFEVHGHPDPTRAAYRGNAVAVVEEIGRSVDHPEGLAIQRLHLVP